jgi:uncharacterized protein (UPF0335 family)
MDIGNKGPILKGIVDALVDLETQVVNKRDDRKKVIKDMKKKKLPAAELIRVAKQDRDKAEEKALKTQNAAGILGVEVYAGSVEPEAPADMSSEAIEEAKELVGQVEAIDDDLDALKEDIKSKKKDAKEAELSVPVIEQIVSMRLQKQDASHFSEYSLTMQAYWAAIA